MLRANDWRSDACVVDIGYQTYLPGGCHRIGTQTRAERWVLTWLAAYELLPGATRTHGIVANANSSPLVGPVWRLVQRSQRLS